MRRLLVLVSVVVFVDTMLFGGLVPLLPGYTDAFELSKLETGLLFAAFGAGALLGGIPGGLIAARVGPKRAVVAGLIVLAVACFGFAVAGSPLALGASRFVQGLLQHDHLGRRPRLGHRRVRPRAARPDARPRLRLRGRGGDRRPDVRRGGDERLHRGRLHGRRRRRRSHSPPPPPSTLPRELRTLSAGESSIALADPAFLVGLWLNTLPAFFFGVLDVLAPLAFDRAGYGAFAIGTVFVLAGIAEVCAAPVVGRASDRRGRLVPIRISLAAASATAVLLALVSPPLLLVAVAIVGAVSFGSLFTPGMALVSDRADLAGLALGLGYGLMNTAWAVGVVLGPTLGGGLAEAFGDPVAYLLCAGLAAATLTAILGRRRWRPSPASTEGLRRGS